MCLMPRTHWDIINRLIQAGDGGTDLVVNKCGLTVASRCEWLAVVVVTFDFNCCGVISQADT